MAPLSRTAAAMLKHLHPTLSPMTGRRRSPDTRARQFIDFNASSPAGGESRVDQ